MSAATRASALPSVDIVVSLREVLGRYCARTSETMVNGDLPESKTTESDRAKVAELYRVHARDLLRRVIMPRCLDADVADEALAETFRAVLTGIERYEPHPAGPFPWLARIAISKTMDIHRARGRADRAKQGFVRMMHPLLPESPAADERSRRRDEQALHAEVMRALETLRPRYAEAIALRFFRELGREECAAAMNITLGSFDVLLLRSLRAARAAIESRASDEERP